MTGDIGKKMYVTKRDGRREEVSFDKVLHRIQTLSVGLEHVNPVLVAQKVCSQIHDGIQTAELDDFAAETAAMMVGRAHPNYGKLAACIAIDNHHKNTPPTFAACVAALFEAGVVSQKLYEVSKMVGIQEMIDYTRDFELFDYFGFKTLEKSYLQKVGGKVVERPQHMWMRVAAEIHTDEFVTEHYGYPIQYVPNMRRIAETYDALSKGYFIHATPTLFNAGTNHTQLSSCFLLDFKSDSIKGIYETLGDCAQISKWAGGIGLAAHKIRAKNSRIAGTNGQSTGIVPMLKVFNDTARYVNQGGKRNGSFAIYLEPWHADIEDFLRLNAKRDLAKAQSAQIRLNLSHQIAARADELQRRRQVVALHSGGLIPQRQTIVARSQEQQNYMLLGVFGLIEAKTREYEAYEGYIEAVRDFWLARVELTRLVGTRLPSTPVSLEVGPSASDVMEPSGSAPMTQHDHDHAGQP